MITLGQYELIQARHNAALRTRDDDDAAKAESLLDEAIALIPDVAARAEAITLHYGAMMRARTASSAEAQRCFFDLLGSLVNGADQDA